MNRSIKQFEEYLSQNKSLINKPIAVVGAGCYGLLTAIMLARKGYAVRIIAKEISEIPSTKAAGFFFPRSRKCSTPQEIALFESMGMESYATYLQIINGQHLFINYGPKLLPAYYSMDIDPGFQCYIAHKLMEAPKNVTIDFGNGKQYPTMEYKTVFINSTHIMQELWRNITELGIRSQEQKLINLMIWMNQLFLTVQEWVERNSLMMHALYRCRAI